MQTYREPPARHQPEPLPAPMASLAVRLMSLSARELRCLNQDNELMRHLGETQLLVESRLRALDAGLEPPNALGQQHQHQPQLALAAGYPPLARQDKFAQHHQQLQQQQLAAPQLNPNLRHNHMTGQQQHQQPQLGHLQHQHQQHQQQHQHQHQHQLHQQHQLQLHEQLLAPNNYYNAYYAQQLALASQMAQQVQHQHQALAFAQQHQQQLNSAAASNVGMSSSSSSVTPTSEDMAAHANHQANFNSKLMARLVATSDLLANGHDPHAHRNQQPAGHHHYHHANLDQSAQQPHQPALDLRTTPTRPMSAISSSSSHSASRAACAKTPAARNADSSHHDQHREPSHQQQQHPKKIKLSEYRKLQQLAEEAERVSHECLSEGRLERSRCNSLSSNSSNNETSPYKLRASNAAGSEPNGFSRDEGGAGQPRKAAKCYSALRAHESANQLNGTSNCSATSRARQTTTEPPPQAARGNPTMSPSSSSSATPLSATSNGTTTTTKKYKGEFDEPTPGEVAQRVVDLDRPQHYHYQALERGECACLLGSEFRDKTTKDVLQMIERWRSLEVEQRIKWKWDIDDLPKDIPLSDIKKFEDLRREFSHGKADFGGASKRKPLGIRGTRQFLLILYCLWGHPGRNDPMQREGYCPHCFAKIKKANEQSILVRVVNHFNMKHRRGANPRLSPQLDNKPASNSGAGRAGNEPVVANQSQTNSEAGLASRQGATRADADPTRPPAPLVNSSSGGGARPGSAQDASAAGRGVAPETQPNTAPEDGAGDCGTAAPAADDDTRLGPSGRPPSDASNRAVRPKDDCKPPDAGGPAVDAAAGSLATDAKTSH